MKSWSVAAVVMILLALASPARAGEKPEKLKEIKQLVIDVERIRRMDPDEQKKAALRVYRTLAPQARDLFFYHLRMRKVDYTKDRDKLKPEAWVEKAWSLTPDAYTYLLWDARAEVYVILGKNRDVLRPLVLADLASKNDKDVKWALHVVAEVRGKEFFEAVLEVFDKNAACSDQAIHALRHMGEPRAIEPLVKRHPDLAGVFEALRTIQHKERAAPALVALLDSKDAEVRWRAAYALSESGDASLVGRCEKLLKDEDPRVRLNAANMALLLDKEAFQRVRPALASLVKDPDLSVKNYALMWLSRQRDPACGPALLDMARDAKLSQQERYEVVRMIHDLTYTQFGFDTSPEGWRPDTPKNQEALRRFAGWVAKNSKAEK